MFDQPDMPNSSASFFKQLPKKLKSDDVKLPVYFGIGLIALFLITSSLAPEISKRLGLISQKKEAQKSFAQTAVQLVVNLASPVRNPGSFVNEPSLGEQKMAIILFKFAAQEFDPVSYPDPETIITPSYLNEILFTDGNSLDKYVAESSYGKTWLAPFGGGSKIFGWYILDKTLPSESFLPELDEKIRAQYPDDALSNYRRIVFIFPFHDVGGAVNSGTPGLANSYTATGYHFPSGDFNTSSFVWLDSFWISMKYYGTNMLRGEFIHSFSPTGLAPFNVHTNHVDALKCSENQLAVALPSDLDPTKCRAVGPGIGAHYDEVSKERFSWLGPGDFVELTTPGRYKIKPYALPGSPKVLVIPRDPSIAAGLNVDYFITYRYPLGLDLSPPPWESYQSQGVVLRNNYRTYNAVSHQLDVTPGSQPDDPASPWDDVDDMRDSVLEVGKSFTIPGRSITVTTVSVNADEATIDVTGPQATCLICEKEVSDRVKVTVPVITDTSIAKVEFYVDGALQGTDSKAAYEFIWDSTKVANLTQHILEARTYDFLTIYFPSKGIIGSSQIPVSILNLPAPTPSLLVAPTNLAVAKPTCSDGLYSATFSWNASSGADFYTLRVQDTGSDQETTEVTTSTVQTPSSLFSPAANYNWWVKANNDGGSSAETQGPDFTVPACLDLVVQSLSYSPADPTANTLMNFSGVVLNQGADPAGSSATSLRIDANYLVDPGWNWGPSSRDAPSLASGATATISWDGGDGLGEWTAPAGTHMFEICADFTGLVTESDENNNCTTQTFTVGVLAPSNLAVAKPVCASGLYSATFSWNLVSGATSYTIRVRDTGSSWETSENTSSTVQTISSLFTPTANYSWWVKANSSEVSSAETQGPSFSVPSCPDTTKPTVSITSPANGAILTRNSTVTIAATASDNVGVSKVQFLVNGIIICTDTQAPYSCSWRVPSKPNTSYTITAKAYDAAGNWAFASITVKTGK